MEKWKKKQHPATMNTSDKLPLRRKKKLQFTQFLLKILAIFTRFNLDLEHLYFHFICLHMHLFVYFLSHTVLESDL